MNGNSGDQLDELQVRKIAQDEAQRVYDKEHQKYGYNEQFRVVPIPYHAHTGVDSAQISHANIIGVGNPRVSSTNSTATPTPNADQTDIFNITAQTVTAAFQNPIGSPANGQFMWLRITSSATGTPRVLTFTSSTGGYIANSPALPSSTTTGKTSILGFQYDTNGALNKWRLTVSANA